MQTAELFRCPECLGQLDPAHDQLRCRVCEREYPVCEGVPVLARRSDFYYVEVSRDRMREVLRLAREIGWKSALLRDADRNGALDFYEYAASDRRSAFKFLLEGFSRA